MNINIKTFISIYNNSMNINLINEFSRLISYIGESDKNDSTNKFRLKQLSAVLSILKKYPKEITLSNMSELKDIGGIGASSMKRIEEILKTGKLNELGSYVDNMKIKKDILENLEEIFGIGRSHALELYDKGITSVEMLKEKIDNKEITVNDKILLGLKYYGKYKMNIPRSEMDAYNMIFKHIIQKINKTMNYDDSNMYVIELCGSYRREKSFSNDIDVLISKKDTLHYMPSKNYLELIVGKLKKSIKSNNNMPLLVDSMTDKKIKTKYMGFSKLLTNPNRRIDIRFIPYDCYYTGLLYFTGSGEFNKKMRLIAKKKGYKLSEYGLFDKNNHIVQVNSERDIFKILDMEYLPPRLR